jgi:hypothetical protein
VASRHGTALLQLSIEGESKGPSRVLNRQGNRDVDAP